MAKLTLYELGECGPKPLPVEQDGSTTIKVSSKTRYALRITSLFPNRLYAYLFYFSTAHQSIRPLYLGVYGSGYIDPPLEPFGELTVGYNNDDMIPGALSFTLAPDEGYFQVFLATSPGDFDSVAQPSPFIAPHTIPNVNEDDYGDGLRVQRYASSEPSERELEPFSAVSPGASRDHSVGIVAAQVVEVSMFERQKANVGRSLDDSIRRLLPEGVRPELLVAHASQWGVVSLKVKCHEPNA
ncbi:hypothetical protein RSOLAG22IIIB_11942 [Rhizoctonia solani]|uniref:Uncharacterized protein n=1 Tax=Rhizoctonia solani TaxID=456999 RepID=A0A0K6GB69_9AGAM|nr:hypothetical protein RSOLAG22IIIB_11942 [Rhizoctonia solani]